MWDLEAEVIDRLVRIGGAWTTFRGERFKIWACEPNMQEIQGKPGELIGDQVVTGKWSFKTSGSAVSKSSASIV